MHTVCAIQNSLLNHLLRNTQRLESTGGLTKNADGMCKNGSATKAEGSQNANSLRRLASCYKVLPAWVSHRSPSHYCFSSVQSSAVLEAATPAGWFCVHIYLSYCINTSFQFLCPTIREYCLRLEIPGVPSDSVPPSEIHSTGTDILDPFTEDLLPLEGLSGDNSCITGVW